jgi:hypothetical protein
VLSVFRWLKHASKQRSPTTLIGVVRVVVVLVLVLSVFRFVTGPGDGRWWLARGSPGGYERLRGGSGALQQHGHGLGATQRRIGAPAHTTPAHYDLLRTTCAPTSTHSSGFCVIWVWSSSSSSSTRGVEIYPLSHLKAIRFFGLGHS